MSRFFALLAVLCLLAASASAQIGIPITGAESAPHCTIAQLAAKTGACSAVTNNGDQIVVVNDATVNSCIASGGGSAEIPCGYHEVLGQWIPLWGVTNPVGENISFASFGITALGSLDFATDLCAGLTNPKLRTTAAGLVECIEEVGGAGGHVIQEEGVGLTARGSLNFVGTGATCTDTGSATQCEIPGLTTYISNGTNFVGSVSCPGKVPASGTAANCEAIVTSFGGQVFAHGYLKLAGTYNAATPHTATDGFKMTEATFLPTCNGSAFECGDDFETFTEQLRGLAATYDPWTSAPQRPKIGFLGYGYNVDPRRPFKLRGARWVLDMSASPDFAVATNADNATTTITGTATITTGTDPSLLVCASCGFHGTGTGYDGDEPLEPGDAFRLTSAGAWGTNTERVYYVTKIVDDDNIRFTPPATSDYSGSIEGATGWLWEFDNLARTGSEADKLDNWGGIEMIAGSNASSQCGGTCLSVNNWSSPQRDNGNSLCTATDVPFDCCTGSGTGTCVGTNRVVPLGGIRSRMQPGKISMDLRGLGGKWDRGVVFTMGNVGASSDVHGEFTGGISMDNGDARNGKFARTGFDDTSKTDDGRNAAFVIMAPNIDINPISAAGGGIYVYGAGPNCGNMTVDARLMENTGQLFYAPNGCQNVMVENVSREQGMFCGGGGQPTCEAEAARHPFIDIGPWEWDDAQEVAHYVFNLNKVFFYLHAQPFLKVVDTQPVRVDLDVTVRSTTDLVDLSSNAIELNGQVKCDPDGAGDCDVTGSGKFGNFQVTDYAGDITFDGRALSTMSGLLPLAKITDDGTASRCLLSGGGGGDPVWGVCPGGGATVVVQEADAAPSVSADTIQFDQNDGFVLSDLGGGNVQVDLSVPWRLATGAVDAVTTDTSLNLIVGSATPSLSDHRLNVDGSVVLNEQGAAVNARIETDTLANAVCTDGTNNRVGIGFGATCSPTVTLDVNGTALATNVLVSATGELRIPQDAAPTTNATGELALDTTIADHQPLLQYYDGGENMTVIAIDTSELPALDNEIVKYDAALDKFVLEADAGTGGSLTVEEADAAPTVASVDTIQVDSADGLALTDETGGNVQIDLLAATASQAGGVTTGTQTFGGAKTFAADVTFDGTGTHDFDGPVTAPSFRADRTSTPTIDFRDLQATDDEADGQIFLNCTVTSTGAEDCDLDVQQYVDGVMKNVIRSVADGGLTVGSDQNTSATITTDGTGDAEVVLPTGSIGTGEILDNTVGSADVGSVDAEASGVTLTVPEKAWLPVASCQNATAGLLLDSPVSNAAVAACITGTNTQKGVADFDTTTDESLQATLKLPSDWSGAVDVNYKWLAAATTGSVTWCTQLVCVADGETDDPAFPAQAAGLCVSDAAQGTTLQTNDASDTGITATGCAAGELMHVRISRDPDATAGLTDDMAGDARLIGVELTIRRGM